ncbi:MAG: MarR family winged helix-turn-helix transcriptional regulator [Cocleimonas sp.]
MNMETLQTNVTKSLWANSAIISKQIDNSLGMLHGIGLTEYMVLNQLMDAPNKHMRRIDVAEAVGRTASGVTRMLIPMEKIGLIEREVNPRDARVSLVKITSVGETKLAEATITLNERSEKILQHFDPKQLNEFLNLLKLIN